MIYIDGLGHMVSDKSLDELHKFAASIGLRREWFQDKRYKHYDLITPEKREAAIRKGAMPVSAKKILHIAIDINGSIGA